MAFREAGVNGFPKGNVENRYFTWQPRVGFTYDLTGRRQDRSSRRHWYLLRAHSGQRRLQRRFEPAVRLPACTDERVLLEPEHRACNAEQPSLNLYPSSLTAIKYNYPPQGTLNWSLGIQHQLMPSVIAAAAVRWFFGMGPEQQSRHQHTAFDKQREQ